MTIRTAFFGMVACAISMLVPGPAALRGVLPATAAPAIEVRSDSEFRKILKAEKGTIVLQITSFDPNCGFCIDANRIFAVLATKHGARMRFIRVHYEPWNNIPAKSVAADLNLQGLPTIVLFRAGQERRRILGHQPEQKLEQLLFGEGEYKLPQSPPPAIATVRDAALAEKGTFQPYNGVWATSQAACRQYDTRLGNARGLDGAIDFVSPQGSATYLLQKRGIRFLDEANNECRLTGMTSRPNTISATLSCFNAVNPDVSTVGLEILESPEDVRFLWRPKGSGSRQERVYQCMAMAQLSQRMARLWRFDSSACTAVAPHSQGQVTFSKDPAGNLALAVSGNVVREYKSAFRARVFVDRTNPIDVKTSVSKAGVSLVLGSFEARANLITEGFLLTISREDVAGGGSGVYEVPVFELPLLGSERAMTFLRGCQPKRAVVASTADQERVQRFIKSFVDQLDRELPEHRHAAPEYRLVDLNDDDRSDVVIRTNSPMYCGSNGCFLFVYRAMSDGQFQKVYEKQSPDEGFPAIGASAKGGHKTLYFPFHTIGDGRVLNEVAEWQGNRYARAYFVDRDIRITPLQDKVTFQTDGVLRERPSASAKPITQQGQAFRLGITENEEGRWLIAKACNGCAYGYAKIR